MRLQPVLQIISFQRVQAYQSALRRRLLRLIEGIDRQKLLGKGTCNIREVFMAKDLNKLDWCPNYTEPRKLMIYVNI